MHDLDKWTIMISKYKDDVLFCGFLYLPSFIHSLLNQTTTFLLEMLWDSAAPATTSTTDKSYEYMESILTVPDIIIYSIWHKTKRSWVKKETKK